METYTGNAYSGDFYPPPRNGSGFKPHQNSDFFPPNNSHQFNQFQGGYSGQFYYANQDNTPQPQRFYPKQNNKEHFDYPVRPSHASASKETRETSFKSQINNHNNPEHPGAKQAPPSNPSKVTMKLWEKFSKAQSNSADAPLSIKSQPFASPFPKQEADPVFPIGLGSEAMFNSSTSTMSNSRGHTVKPQDFVESVGWKIPQEEVQPRFSYAENLSQSTDSSSSSLSFQNSGRFVQKPEIQTTPSQTKVADESKSSEAVAGEIMKMIADAQINCVSLLNEVASKMKKKVEYPVQEVPLGKIKVFECTCLFESKEIGFKKGNSKQGAKTDASRDGVNTLLLKEEYVFEKAHLILLVQKITGIGINNPSPTSTAATPSNANYNQTTSLDMQLRPRQSILEIEQQTQGSKSQTFSVNDNTDSQLANDSALYELNLLAKECGIELNWEMSSAEGPNGQFEAHVQFDKIIASGKGRKKLEAKRDAAYKIIQQIRQEKELNDKYSSKNMKKKVESTNNGSQFAKNDTKRQLFESCIKPKMLKEIQTDNENWKESATKLEKEYNQYLSRVYREAEFDEETERLTSQFYKQISDYSILITSSPKQILLNEEKHFADYVKDFQFIPIGSFALDCMRKNCLSSINVLALYTEAKKASKKELLELYSQAFQECHRINQSQNNSQFSDMKIKVIHNEFDEVLEITANSSIGKISLQIQLCVESGCHDSILHIKRVYDCFEDSEKLKQFRTLMSLMRGWRTKNGLWNMNPELMDGMLLAMVLNNKAGSIAGYILNLLVTMSTEETFKTFLQNCGQYYVQLYKELPMKAKWEISKKCTQSLEAVYQGDFSNIQ